MQILFKTILILLVLPSTTNKLIAQNTQINWLSPDELSVQYAENKKPILVDVYTTWCGYCKIMDKSTWKNDSVAAYVSTHFYAVKLDAENKKTYQWLGETYNYSPKYKANMLAVKLLDGEMAYPGTVLIPVKGEKEVIQGAFKPKEIEIILKYYGNRVNETTSPNNFQKIFKGYWK